MNQLIERGLFEKIWLNENVYIEVFKYKGESQIHIRHTDEGVMLTKNKLGEFSTFNAKMIAFDRF